MRQRYLCSFLFLFTLIAVGTSHENHDHQHKCIHDEDPIEFGFIDTGSPQMDHEGRVLLNWQSIRILLDFSSTFTLLFFSKYLALTGQDALKNYIQKTVLPPVYNLLSSALKVIRLTSPLTANGQTTMCSGAVTTPAIYNNGGVDADLVIFVLSVTDSASNYIAKAGACDLDTTTYR